MNDSERNNAITGIAVIAAIVCGIGWASAGSNASNANNQLNIVLHSKTSDNIDNVISEDNDNYNKAITLEQAFNALESNASKECGYVGDYFGSAAANDCDSEMGNGVSNSPIENEPDNSAARSMQDTLNKLQQPSPSSNTSN
jgi:hypothetical protein